MKMKGCEVLITPSSFLIVIIIYLQKIISSVTIIIGTPPRGYGR